MSINKKSSNETHAAGKGWPAAALKNTGPDKSFIWRLPEEDFRINAELTVMPGEEALFVKGGSIGQIFESGKYKLSPQSYSFISRLRNLSTGGMNAFNCIVYFIRKNRSMEVSWRTSTPILARDRGVGIITEIHARGSYIIEVDKPRRFLTNLIENNITDVNHKGILEGYFKDEFLGKIKASITRAINKTETELLGLDKQLDEFSYVVQIFFSEAMQDYGLKVVRFSIAALNNDEFETPEQKNEKTPAKTTETHKKIAPKPAKDGAAALHKSAKAPAPNAEDPVEVLKKLKDMLELGLIEQSEYDEKKTEVMSRL